MNFKKALSAVLAGAMSLSMVNGVLAVTEGTGTYITIDSFDDKASGWQTIDKGSPSFSKNYDHTGNNGGSLRFDAGNSYNKNTSGIRKDITAKGLKKGKTYKVTGWVYGERVKGVTTSFGTDRDNASAVYWGFQTNLGGPWFADNVLGNDKVTELKQGEWTKVESYFVAQGNAHVLYFNVPYYLDSKNYPNDYDIYYLDDITLEEQTNADILHYTPNYDYSNDTAKRMANSRSYNRLNPDNEITYGAKYIDLTGTQKYIKLGETAELNAAILTAVQGQKTGTIKRDAADKQYISVKTNEDYLTYSDGVFTAVNPGVSIAEITYSDGTFTDTRMLLIAVYADGAEMCSAETLDTWQYPNITDPLDKNNDIYVGTAKNYKEGNWLSTSIPMPANKYTVLSYRSYCPGVDNSIIDMGRVDIAAGNNLWGIYDSGSKAFAIGPGLSSPRKDLVVTGWNNVDYVFKPIGENKSNVSIYFNGTMLASVSNVAMADDTKFVCSVFSGVLVDDFKVVTIDLEPKVSEVKLPAEGETLSTLGDIDISFTEAMTVSDGGIKILDSESNETEIRVFASDDNKTYTVKPYGGLKPDCNYKVVFDPEKITLVTDPTIKLSSSTGEYTFKTDSTDVSDVIGKGYTLINTQYDMIGKGDYTLADKATEFVKKSDELTAKYVNRSGNYLTPFIFTAKDYFTKDTQKADRYIVEFDAKVVMDNITDKTQCNEWLRVAAVDADGKEGVIGHMGTNPLRHGAFAYRYNAPNSDNWGTAAVVYDTELGHDKVQPFNGYMHFKYVYDFGQVNENGKVLQTVYLTDTTGATYTYGPVYGYSEVDYGFNKDLDPVAVSSLIWMTWQTADRELSIKNVNMYALKKSTEAEDAVETSDFVVTDENNNVAAEITGGNKYSVSCKVKNNSYAGDSLTIIAGIYTTDNKLIAVKTATTNAQTGNEDIVRFDTLDVSSAPADGAYVLKVFCWNSLDAGVPVTDIIYPLAQ